MNALSLAIAALAQQPPTVDLDWGDKPHAQIVRVADFDGDGVDDLVFAMPRCTIRKTSRGEVSMPRQVLVVSARRGATVARVASDGFVGVVEDVGTHASSIALWERSSASLEFLSVPTLAPSGCITAAELGERSAPWLACDVAHPFEVDGRAIALCWIDPYAAAFGRAAHSIRVVEKRSGRTLCEIEPPAKTDAFGLSLDGSVDFDCDGVPELCVAWRGGVGVYSLRDRRWLWIRVDDEIGASGYAPLAIVDDFDRDGTSELAIGEPHWRVGGARRGRVVILSGATGRELSSFSGRDDEKLFGFQVAAAGDFDGDGNEELLVSSPFLGGIEPDDPRATNCVWLMSLEGTRRRCFQDAQNRWGGEEVFGVSLIGRVDLDRDGRLDALIASERDPLEFDFTRELTAVTLVGGYELHSAELLRDDR